MLPTENLPSYIPTTTEVAVSGTSRTNRMLDVSFSRY